MDNWDDLRYVLAMIRHGTMSAAARYLGSNVATVSRRIERLSHDLDTTLFEKRGQGWVATDAAQRLAKLAEGFDQSLRGELNALETQADHPPVEFEVTAPPAVHRHFLIPHLPELMEQVPNVRLNLTNKVYAQGLGEADVQIRIGRPEGGRLRAKKFLDFELAVYHGADHTLDGRWIGISHKYPDADDLRNIYTDAAPLPVFRVEEMPWVLHLCATTGLPALLPDFLAEKEPSLVRADLPDNARPFELWIAYHETRHGDATLRKVMDWCSAQVGRRGGGTPVAAIPNSAAYAHHASGRPDAAE